MPLDHPFTLSDRDFQAFAELVHQKAGIKLHGGKKELVRARLSKRIREGEFDGFGDYFEYVIHDESGDELVQLLDAISTNLTHFFRESHHFDYLAGDILPGWKNNTGARRIRIWSAGCSTGEEPYSIAMTVADKAPGLLKRDFKILATDLSTRVLAAAHSGTYRADRTQGLPQSVLQRFFHQGRGEWSGYYRVREEIRRLITFRRLNLVQRFPLKGPFDLIFCRNVMIYFDKATQAELIARFHEILHPGGHLFIGHSESLSGLNHRFKYVQPTVYRK